MTKRDMKKELAHLYGPSAKEVVAVDVPGMDFLMVDGEGDPNSAPAYAEAVEALFTLSYALKFAVRSGTLAIDYGVMPLEGLWWADDMSRFATDDRAGWRWTMMIMQPSFVSRHVVEQTAALVLKKKGLDALRRIRFEPFGEGAAAQVLHIGPFAAERPTIERVHDFIARRGCERTGKHHEIYLSDIRRVEPAKWRTIIRQPMT